MVLFTLGTGVGGGIIIDNQLVVGANSLGGEVGHFTVDSSAGARICSCGRPGHLEAYASATALVARCREALELDRASKRSASSLHELGPQQITAKKIHEAALAGDSLALELIDETADYLARGIAAICHLLDPHAFMLGGAMTFGRNDSPVGRRFLQRIKSQVAAHVFPSIAANLIVDYATLGGDAGFVGAAGLAAQAAGVKLGG
jgi:glucokinase